jgi:hypothetical protein
MWTSPNYLPFLAITSHFINSSWEIKNILVDFVYVGGSHTGKNIADSFLKSIQEMNILSKVKLN